MNLRALILLMLPLSAWGQYGTITGRVTGKGGEENLVGVNVVVQGTLRGTTTDRSGIYHLDRIPPGTYTLGFSLLGYRRELVAGVLVTEGVTTPVDVELTPLPVQAEPVIVTANKREQSLQDAPVSVSVMDAVDISFRNSITIDDALRYVPGVNMTEFQVNIRGSSGYSRGVGSRVLLLIDGIPFLTGDTGEINFETIPIGQVDRIEVVKGASSALYGSNALGGVINILTKPLGEVPVTAVRLYGGFYGAPSYDGWDWGGGTRFLDGQSFSHSRREGDLSVLLHSSRVSDDGYRRNDFRRRYNGYLKLRYDLSPYNAVTSTFSLLHQRRGSFLYWRDIDHALVPPDAQLDDRVKSTRFFWSGNYTHALSDRFLVSARGMWFKNRWDDTIDTLTNNSRSDVLRAELQGTLSADDRHILTFGVEGNTDRVEADLFGSRRGGGGAVYVQDEIRVGGEMKVSVGARFDAQDIDSLESHSQFNPKVAVVYTPAVGTALRASAGRGFRTPSVAEAFITTQAGGLDIIPNPGLRPERSTSLELGLSQFFGESAALDLALFHSDFSDLIEPRFVEVNQELKGQFNNVTKARVQGFETSVKFALLRRSLFFDLGYTFVEPRDRTENDILKYRPRHVLYLSSQARAGLFTLGMDFRYLDRIGRIDEEFNIFVQDASMRVPIYVTDVRLSADLSEEGIPLAVTLNVKNVFQYNYVELIGNLAPPRTMILTVQAEW